MQGFQLLSEFGWARAAFALAVAAAAGLLRGFTGFGFALLGSLH